MNSYPRETVEFVPIVVTLDGQAVTANVKFATTVGAARPETWESPVTIDGKMGVMTLGHDPGTFHVWAQVTDNPEIPVIYCGRYQLT